MQIFQTNKLLIGAMNLILMSSLDGMLCQKQHLKN